MAYVAERLTFEEASSDWALLQRTLRNDSVFFTLPWQKWWWELFGQGDLHLCRVTLDRQVIGIAPLMYRDNIWRFLGGTDLFDYHECLVLEGHEVAFFERACPTIPFSSSSAFATKFFRESTLKIISLSLVTLRIVFKESGSNRIKSSSIRLAFGDLKVLVIQ